MITFFYDKWTVFLAFVLSGVLIGAVYDVFRIFRIARTYNEIPELKIFGKIIPLVKPGQSHKYGKFLHAANSAVIFAEDILFWVAAALIETVFIYYFNNGEIRVDFFLYSAAGFFAYTVSVGKFVVFSAKKIIFLCRCLIFYILYIIMYPIKALCSVLFGISRKIIMKIYDIYDGMRSESAMNKLLKDAGNGFGI